MKVKLPIKDKNDQFEYGTIIQSRYAGVVVSSLSFSDNDFVQDWQERIISPTSETYQLYRDKTAELIAIMEITPNTKEQYYIVNLLERVDYKQQKEYLIAPPMIAFACYCSEERGYDGIVAIHTKQYEKLVQYYQEVAPGSPYTRKNSYVTIIYRSTIDMLIDSYLIKGGDTS